MSIKYFVPKQITSLVKHIGIYSLMALGTGCISHPASWPPEQNTNSPLGLQRFAAQSLEKESDGRCWQKGRVCLDFNSKTLNTDNFNRL
ncbi:MAG: hypothetical protein RQ757_06040 [Pseudomonadales bacterium]|nr:hypothetical protein [Pseudomonadales bacterium]